MKKDIDTLIYHMAANASLSQLKTLHTHTEGVTSFGTEGEQTHHSHLRSWLLQMRQPTQPSERSQPSVAALFTKKCKPL